MTGQGKLVRPERDTPRNDGTWLGVLDANVTVPIVESAPQGRCAVDDKADHDVGQVTSIHESAR